MKTNYPVGVILIIVLVSGCAQIANKCAPNYDLNRGRILNESNPDDLKFVQRVNVRKECLDGSEPERIQIIAPKKGCMDCNYETGVYCKNEGNFLLIKGGFATTLYLFEGKPCK